MWPIPQRSCLSCLGFSATFFIIFATSNFIEINTCTESRGPCRTRPVCQSPGPPRRVARPSVPLSVLLRETGTPAGHWKKLLVCCCCSGWRLARTGTSEPPKASSVPGVHSRTPRGAVAPASRRWRERQLRATEFQSGIDRCDAIRRPGSLMRALSV